MSDILNDAFDIISQLEAKKLSVSNLNIDLVAGEIYIETDNEFDALNNLIADGYIVYSGNEKTEVIKLLKTIYG